MEFDFDAWAKLAKEDPEAFERQREAALRSSIESAPPEHRQRLEGLQFQLNMERQRAGTALGSCLRLNSLMWSGFFRLRKELNGLAEGAQAPKADGSRTSAEVISMQNYRKARAVDLPAEP
jgi:hypothetical protein